MSAALGVALAASGAGCDPEPAPVCQETYRHLVAIARRNPEPEGEASFVAACVAAWDPKRLKCLDAARTVSEALACKPVKKRPG